MPLMLAMFIDLVEISLFFSLAFQKEKIDLVSSMHAITKSNKHLALFSKNLIYKTSLCEAFTIKM